MFSPRQQKRRLLLLVVVFSFVYQLTNPSLMPYRFKFTTELNLSFPSCASSDLKMVHGSTTYDKPGWEYSQIEGATKWSIEDSIGGLRVHFQTQKPVDIWCIPPSQPTQQQAGVSHGLTLMLSSEIELEPSSQWKIIGKISFRKHKKKGTINDVC